MANKVNKALESFTTSLHNYIKYYTLTRNIKLTYISNVGSNINHVTVAGNNTFCSGTFSFLQAVMNSATLCICLSTEV